MNRKGGSQTLNMVEWTQFEMLKIELSSVKQVLYITRGDILTKCIDCEEFVREAVRNCIPLDVRGERTKRMQETLCAKCPLHQYHLEYKEVKM